MNELLVFGTGNAMVTRYYNTCFALYDGNEYFMVDAGGGNGIFAILEKMDVPFQKIHHIFFTHEHSDHILGAVWMVRKIGTLMNQGKYDGNLHIYCHKELVETIRTLCRLTLQKKVCNHFGERILLIPVENGEEKQILSYDVTFFDIHSTKAKQFGFTAKMADGQKLTCLGDEPYNEKCKEYIAGSDWMLCEAFCLYGDRERFKPYEKHHTTVKEACELAEGLHIPNVVLWHTEDKTAPNRKELYTQEGKGFYQGNLLVPDDGERILL